MLHERLRDGDTSFGLTPAQYASREKARLREREKKRRQRAMQAARQRNEAGRFIAAPSIVTPVHGEVFSTPHGPAYCVVRADPNGRGYERTNITLPWVSLLAKEA